MCPALRHLTLKASSSWSYLSRVVPPDSDTLQELCLIWSCHEAQQDDLDEWFDIYYKETDNLALLVIDKRVRRIVLKVHIPNPSHDFAKKSFEQRLRKKIGVPDEAYTCRLELRWEKQ